MVEVAGRPAGADFFLADCCSQIRGDDGARASGADADVGGRRRDEVRGRRLTGLFAERLLAVIRRRRSYGSRSGWGGGVN